MAFPPGRIRTRDRTTSSTTTLEEATSSGYKVFTHIFTSSEKCDFIAGYPSQAMSSWTPAAHEPGGSAAGEVEDEVSYVEWED